MIKKKKDIKTFDKLGFYIAFLPAFLAAYLLFLVPKVMAGDIIIWRISWVPSMGAELSLQVDGLSLLFGLIITGVGSLVLLYSSAYLYGEPLLNRFYVYMLLFMGSMLGLVFSSNLITMFIFWELTSLTSFLLIGFYHDRTASRRAALQALLVTGLGGLVLLVGFLLLGITVGSFDIQILVEKSEAIRSSSLYTAMLGLVLIGVFTKSAQFPFHFWLPNAMEAPAPVSAYLHSATMVKAGVFLLARLTPVLGGTSLWSGIIVPVGGITMLLTAWLALGQTDLKRILAYSTVSVLGMLVFLLGLNNPLSVKVAVVLLVAHALYKGSLFLASGSVDHETGSRDIMELSGLRKFMPLTALAMVFAALSQAGIPPFWGFISKELLYEVALDSYPVVFYVGLVLATNIFLVSIAGFVAIRPFFGKSSHAQKKPHEAPWPMWIGPVVLSILGLVFSFFPNRVGTYLISPAAGAILGEPQKVKLALWHGITPMLILSGITIFLGALLYVFQHHLRNTVVNMDFGHRFGPDRIYRLSLAALERYAQIQTRFLQNGSLPRYILTVLLAAIGLIGFTFLNNVSLEGILVRPEGIKFYGWVLPSIIIAATIAIVIARSRLAAVASLGVIGFSIAMLFILFGAPDLAMTQFAIETLTVILFVFVLYRLPRFTSYTGKATRLRDAFIAVFAGAMMTLLVLVITSTPLVSRLTPFFAQNSYTLAKGRNIVNVILVDFRGIDTLGEITVLAVAAIGVFALMKLRPNKEAELGHTPHPDSPRAQENMLESTNNQDYLE